MNNIELKQKVLINKFYRDGKIEEIYDEVLIEYVFSIYLNDNLLVELLCIPRKLEELVVGYLYTEKIINSLEDIKNIYINEEEAYAKVEIDIKEVGNGTSITTDSGDFRMVPYQFYFRNDLRPLNKLEFKPQTIIDNFQKLINGSELFRNTGNVHSVQICIDDKVLYFAEDIGRYNALDKCVGQAIKDKVDLSKCALYTSGRIPSTIAMKALRSNIPIIVSRSAPSNKTLEVARKYNLTIIGFATKEKINIYNVQNDI